MQVRWYLERGLADLVEDNTGMLSTLRDGTDNELQVSTSSGDSGPHDQLTQDTSNAADAPITGSAIADELQELDANCPAMINPECGTDRDGATDGSAELPGGGAAPSVAPTAYSTAGAFPANDNSGANQGAAHCESSKGGDGSSRRRSSGDFGSIDGSCNLGSSSEVHRAPITIRLKFEPRGRGHSDDYYYVSHAPFWQAPCGCAAASLSQVMSKT